LREEGKGRILSTWRVLLLFFLQIRGGEWGKGRGKGFPNLPLLVVHRTIYAASRLQRRRKKKKKKERGRTVKKVEPYPPLFLLRSADHVRGKKDAFLLSSSSSSRHFNREKGETGGGTKTPSDEFASPASAIFLSILSLCQKQRKGGRGKGEPMPHGSLILISLSLNSKKGRGGEKGGGGRKEHSFAKEGGLLCSMTQESCR